MRITKFTALLNSPRQGDPENGKSFTWSYHKGGSGYWVLTDYDGYERTLEKTWTESLPAIRQCLENHCMVPHNPSHFEIESPIIAELLDALQDCAGVLDSINRHVAGTSVAVIAVLEKAQRAINNS